MGEIFDRGELNGHGGTDGPTSVRSERAEGNRIGREEGEQGGFEADEKGVKSVEGIMVDE